MVDSANFDYKEFDKLLALDGPVMIGFQQFLKPASISPDEIVFPPSYAATEKSQDDDASDESGPSVYNIDVLDPSKSSKNVCVLDSIPSQANRIEPIFARPEFFNLIPQYSVKLKDDVEPVSILAIGHRLADAVFRGTTLRESIIKAFKTFANGNATEIAKLGPTSLVFGVWDSRGTTYVKVPRLINSIIRAFDVVPLRRSAQYTPPIKYQQEGLLPDDLAGKPSKYGLADVPSPLKIGGVQINGDIRRDCSLNLSSLRMLKGATPDDTKKLQRYILALSLLALTATPDLNLRQGCNLIPKGKPLWKTFTGTGDEIAWVPENFKIDAFAVAAAADFVVKQPPNQPLVFDKKLLKSSIDADVKKKADKKKPKSDGATKEVAK